MDVFAKRLKELRMAEGISQRKLAESLDVSHVAVGMWERGVSLPSILQLKKLSILFDVSSDYLLGLKNT